MPFNTKKARITADAYLPFIIIRRIVGRAEGELAKALAIAKNLLSINLPLDQIAATTGLTIEEVESLRCVD